MKLIELVRQERQRYVDAGNSSPNIVYVGDALWEEVVSAIKELRDIGYVFPDKSVWTPIIDGMAVDIVLGSARITFGVDQPSPCG